ncbi:hypothetical protein DFH06DRAFT_1307778 [Mycena polygramma]|nr:hypothetical protein DFH06DRAFT_1307778 [Mycena polygramma]
MLEEREKQKKRGSRGEGWRRRRRGKRLTSFGGRKLQACDDARVVGGGVYYSEGHRPGPGVLRPALVFVLPPGQACRQAGTGAEESNAIGKKEVRLEGGCFRPSRRGKTKAEQGNDRTISLIRFEARRTLRRSCKTSDRADSGEHRASNMAAGQGNCTEDIDRQRDILAEGGIKSHGGFRGMAWDGTRSGVGLDVDGGREMGGRRTRRAAPTGRVEALGVGVQGNIRGGNSRKKSGVQRAESAPWR